MLDLGRRKGGRAVLLSERERTRHVHVVGATDSGKSKFLQHLIRQDIRRGRGFCLIDPKGGLAKEVEAWCASRGYGRVRRIHLVRPGFGEFAAGFNPLRLDRGEAPKVRVDATVDACTQIWGGEDLNEKPRLKKILRAVFFALAVRRLTLVEAPYLLSSTDRDVRDRLTEGLPDEAFQFIWDDLNALTRREFSEYAESSVSRVSEFLTSPPVRLMLGQQAAAIDFRRVMDNNEIVIVDVQPGNGLSRADARLVGALIINDLFLTALARDEATALRRPFTLYVDECHDFLSGDVAVILDRARSQGLHAVLAHQRLGQLMDAGENIHSAVMGSTRTKVVFGGLEDRDAEVMAREILRSEIDLEEAKPILDRRVVVGDELWWLEAENWSRTEGSSQTYTETDGDSVTETSGTSESLSYEEYEDQERELVGSSEGESSSSAVSSHHSSSFSEVSNSSDTRGGSRQQSLRSAWGVAHVPYTLEEQFHRAQLKLREMPDRTAIVKRAGKRSVRMRTREVETPLCSANMLSRFREAAHERSPYVASVASAEAEMAARRATLDLAPPVAAAEESFWTE